MSEANSVAERVDDSSCEIAFRLDPTLIQFVDAVRKHEGDEALVIGLDQCLYFAIYVHHSDFQTSSDHFRYCQ